jgi:hypothetical protein
LPYSNEVFVNRYLGHSIQHTHPMASNGAVCSLKP